MNFDLLYITYFDTNVHCGHTHTDTNPSELPTAKYLPQGDQHVT